MYIYILYIHTDFYKELITPPLQWTVRQQNEYKLSFVSVSRGCRAAKSGREQEVVHLVNLFTFYLTEVLATQDQWPLTLAPEHQQSGAPSINPSFHCAEVEICYCSPPAPACVRILSLSHNINATIHHEYLILNTL